MSGRDCKSVAKRRAIWKFFGVEAGVSKVPQGEKTRLARLECLEERALLAVLADAAVEQSEWATHNESALEIPVFADAQESGVATFAVIGFGTGTTTAVAESLAVADAESAKLPGVPSGLQLENFNAETKTATLRWDAVADATECEVELSLDAGATWSPVGSVSGDANEIALTNLPDAAVVRCRARATNGALTSIWANAAFAVGEIETNGTRETAVALGDLTGCAQNLTQTAGGEYGEDWFSFEIPSVGAADDRLTLSYEHDYSKHYLNFELYNAEGTRLTGATGSIGEKSISLKNRAAGTYYVRVYPYRGGATQYSLTVETAATAPDAPTHLRVDALNTAKKTAVLTWDDVDGETGYVVESSLDGTTWTTLGIAEANATTFDVSDAAAGVKYRARAVGEFEYSNWTETSLTVVTTALDVVDANDGVLSFREALESAEVGATVAFDSTVFTERATIELNGTELALTKRLALVAPEAGLVLDAKGASRIINIAADAGAVFVDGFTFVGGLATGSASYSGGGAIYVASNASLTVVDSSFKNNEAAGSSSYSGGGAIYVAKNASLTVDNSDFTGNKAAGSASYSGGGAIYVASNASLTVADSGFENNEASGSASNSGGGAIYAGATSVISGSEFKANTARYGGAIYLNSSSSGVYDSLFFDNAADYDGGAICITASSNEICRSKFEGNTARDGGALQFRCESGTLLCDGLEVQNNAASSSGGGIYSYGRLTLTNSSICVNSARLYGGGISVVGGLTFGVATIVNVEICGNVSQYGGGIYYNGGSLTMTDFRVANNKALSDNKNANIGGGGICHSCGTLALTNGEIVGNAAGIDENGAADASASACGGGIYTDCGYKTIGSQQNVLIAHNEAKTDGGGVYLAANSSLVKYAFYNATVAGNVAGGQGGGVANNSEKFELYNSIIAKNVSTSGAAPDVFHDGGETKICVSLIGDASGLFGADGVYASGYALLGDAANPLDPGFVDAANGDFSLTAASPAVDAGLAYWEVPETDLDGAPRKQGNRIDLGAYEFAQADFVGEAETASTVVTTAFDVVDPYDGLISLREAIQYAESGATITFDTTIFAKKTTIELAGAELIIDKSLTFVAPEVGLALDAKKLSRIATVNSEASVSFDGFEFVNGRIVNGATVGAIRGGAIYADSGTTLTVADSTFTGNEAQSGGAIYAYASSSSSKGASLTIADSTFTNNAATEGGAVYVVASSSNSKGGALLTIADSTFAGNEATSKGGALYVSASSSVKTDAMTIDNSTFKENTATEGGALYADASSRHVLTVANSNFTSNEATSKGGAIYNADALELINFKLNDNKAYRAADASVTVYGGAIYNTGTLKLTNGEIVDNVAEAVYTGTRGYGTYAYGGAIYNAGTATATNVTFANNEARAENPKNAQKATAYGGGIYNYSGTATLQNAIVVENDAVNGADVYVESGSVNAYFTLSSYAFTTGENNYLYDASAPLFDANSDDYRLAQFSQAVDKGNAQLALDAGLTEDGLDLAGKSRFIGETIDLGAYESEFVDNISQSGVFNGVVELSWKQTLDKAVALRLTWISGAKSSVLGVFGASGEFDWDTTSFDDGAGRLIVEYLDKNDAVLQSATIAATIINDENVVVKRGTVDENETWEAGKVYLVVGRLDVASGATLTLGEGAVVKFWRGATIYAQEGAGVIIGDAATLTRAEDDAVGGDTNKDGENSVAKYGTSYFKGLGNFQVSATATVKYVATTTSATLKNNETWLGGQVYHVTGDLTVPSGVTLTILPGAILKFDAGKSLIVEKGGTLIAEGTSAAPIVFTSIKDDAVGGDTNADNGRYEPQPGDWKQIRCNGNARLNCVEIRYCSNSNNQGGLFVTGGNVIFKNSRIAYTEYDAVRVNGGTFWAENSIFEESSIALRPNSGTSTIVNCVVANSTTGLRGGAAQLYNTIFYNVSLEFFDVSFGRPNVVKNCFFWNPKGAGPQTFYAVGSNGNIWANPLFRDAANGDYRLSAGSPCVDAADGTLAPETDADGTPRFTDAYSEQLGTPDANGVYVDVGAYEFADVAASSLDLEPVDLKAPTSAAVGETVTLEWTTRNNGTVAATGAWSDEIYLVSASGREILVATILRAAAIGAGDLQTSYAQVTIPKSVKAGEWTFAVRVNPNRDVFEGDATANNVRTANAKTTISVPYLVASETFASTMELEYYKLYVPANTTYYLKYTTASELLLKTTPPEYETTLYLGEGYLPTERKCDATSSSWNLSALIEKKVGAIYAQSTWETVLCVPASNVEREVYVGVRAKEAETVGSLTLEEGNAFRVLGFEHTTYISVVSDSAYGTLRYAWNDSNEKQITIVGTGFYDGMSAVLTSNDEPALGGVGEPLWVTPGPYYPTIEVVSPTKAILTFHERVNARTPKDRSLTHDYVLTVDGSESLDLTVSEDGWIESAFPTATLELPDAIRAGRVYQGTIRYSNETSDLLAPLFVLSANKGTQLSLTEDFSDATNTLQVLGLGGGDPGTLAYRDSGEITFYFKSEGNVNIDLGSLYYKDNEACDDTTYFATWREYHEALCEATKRLNARDKTNYSAQDAFALAVQTKLGEPASAISGYLEDSRDLEPIAGATLFARWIAEDGATRVRYFETDENGWFSLDYLPANTTFTLGTVDADALSQTTVTLGDSDVNGLRLTALSKDKTQTRAVAVGADLLAYVVCDKASLTNNRTAQATLIVQNTSDKPVDAALLTLTATNDRGERNAMLTLDAAQAQVPYFSTFMPDGFASSISLLTSGASNGVLGPGETLEIPVYWGGWVKPWDSASFEFELNLVEKTETVALDAAEMEKSLRESFTTSRGAAWADDEWALVWASASETFGSSWGDYVSALLDASATAAQNGRETNDVDKLTQTIFARALDAFSPFAIPASSVDAAVGSDASSLTFQRVYLGNLSGRFLDSPLGRGWRHNWDYSLRSNDDGTVYLDTPSGATRAFQPSRRGATGTILTSTGTDDQGVLLRASDGTFELTELDGTEALFDADGRLTRIVDANGNAVDLTYDGAGLLTRVADGWGHSLTLRYSAKRIVAVVDSNGDETTYEYNGAYLTKATGPTGRAVSYRYGDSGGALNALSEIEFADGTTRRFEYDETGRRVGVVDSDGAAERIEWLDATSYKVFDGDVCQGTVYLNDDGAPIKSVDALNRTTVYVYDKDGRLLETTDAQGKTTRYEYDGAGNAILSVDANGSTLGFEYDAKSFLTKLTDGNGNSSVFEYDAAGNQTLWERVDGTSSSWSYAENGTLTQATDRAGATVSYEYAENGDMTSLQYSTEENAISYEYDERGNAVRIVDANGAVTTLAYDAHDRLTKVVYATGRFLEYEYDALGRQISVSDGGDYYVGYAYDAQRRLAQVLDASGTAITVYAYDAQGRLSREEASNGVYTVYAYDALSRLTSKATFTVDGDAISSFAYTYDALDLVRTLTTLDGVWTYAYDATGQITASTFDAAPGSSLANRSYEFAYDAAGNRIWSKIDGVERTYTYDNMNRLLSDGEFEYLYDANGNLTSKNSATEAFSYVWNQRGEMLSCVASTGERWDYEYDVFGALIAVTRTDAAGNVERTEYLVDPNAELSSVVSSFDGDGNLVANYIYGLALVGQTDGAGTTAIYASDALGSTAALTGPNGETLNRYAYDQHGAVLAATETVATPFQFVGTQGVMTGVSSELVQMRARWYDPATGRFVSEDPLGYNAGDANLYRYCANAVTVATDPSGMSPAALPVYVAGKLIGDTFATIKSMLGDETEPHILSDQLADQPVEILDKVLPDQIVPGGKIGKEIVKEILDTVVGDRLEPILRDYVVPGYEDIFGDRGKALNDWWREYDNRNNSMDWARKLWESVWEKIWEFWDKKGPTVEDEEDVEEEEGEHYYDDIPEPEPDMMCPLDDAQTQMPQSCDPNETRGPVGFDCVTVDANVGVEGADPFLVITTPNWTNADPNVERGFRIYFENKSTATAAAQEVFITSTLPAGYDLSSFELREVAIGNQVFDAPVGCVDGVWTVKQKSTGEEIRISVEYDPATGDVKWYLRSYVVSTPDHFPTDPYAGFLPPNDKSIGNGEGYVSFVVKYEDGLITGTKPETNATIVFDANEPIVTNWWHNTVDADAPTAEIADIKYDEEARTVAVEWRGVDVGSGIACYDAYYSVDGGETYSLWLERTTETSATILASAERYVFKIVAYDNVGHSSAGVDATFEIIGGDVTRLGASEYVVEQNAALCLSATGGAPEGWTYYWDLSGSEVEVSSNFIERGAEFWTTVEELGFDVGEHAIRMRPRDASGIFGPTVTATLRVVATQPTFNVTTSSSVDGSILRLSLQATTPDDSPIARWRLDWGDGQTSEFAQLSDALTAGHYYAPTAEDAVYEVSLTALDATGNGSDVVYALTSHKVAGSGAASQAAAWTATETSALGDVSVAKETADVDAASFEVAEASLEALSVEAKSVSGADNVDAAVLTATETAFDSASRGGYQLSLPDAVSTTKRRDAALEAFEAFASTSVLDDGEFASDCGVDVWSEIEAALVADETSRKSKRRDPFEALDVWGDDLESLGAFGF